MVDVCDHMCFPLYTTTDPFLEAAYHGTNKSGGPQQLTLSTSEMDRGSGDQ